MIRVVLADDHAVLRAGLRAFLDAQGDMQVVADSGDGAEVGRLAALHRPDVVVLDISMPGNERLAALRDVGLRCPASRVVMLTMHEDEALLREALRLGAAGYVLKKSAESELVTAIRAAHRGDAFIDATMTRLMIDTLHGRSSTADGAQATAERLTAREADVFRMVVDGHANREIAAALFISVKTVETHKLHIAEKTGLRSRVEWVRYARRHGIIGPAV